MKNKIKLLIIFVSLSGTNTAQISKQWEGAWGGNLDDQTDWLLTAADSSYFLVGLTESPSYGSNDCWIVHVDKSGNYLWDKRYGGTGDDGARFMISVSDGYILACATSSDSGIDVTEPKRGYYDYWLLKIDFNGNKIWDRRYGGDSISASYLVNVLQTSDGGFLLAGFSYSDSANEKTMNSFGYLDYWLLKTDSLGNKLWDKTYGGSSTENLQAIEQDDYGNYYLTGMSHSPVSGNKSAAPFGNLDYWVVKVDSAGNKIWDKSFGSTDDDAGRSIINIGNNKLLIGGDSRSPVGGNKTSPAHNNSWDYWFVLIDTSGAIIWDKSFGGNDHDNTWGKVQILAGGKFMMSGISYSNISGDKTEANLGIRQGWILTFDSTGSKIWDKTIFSNGFQNTGYAYLLEDSCLVYTSGIYNNVPGGYFALSQFGGVDYWAVKLCGQIFTGTQEIAGQTNGVNLFPNPFINTFKIQTQNLKVNKVIVKNIMGQIVFEKTVPKNIEGEIEINPGEITSGIYIIAITDREGNLKTGKLVKQ